MEEARVTRWILVLALAAGPACRMEVSASGTQQAAPGEAIEVAAETGALSLDQGRVPVLPPDTPCETGHLLGRTDTGWGCRAETPSLGEHDHDEDYPQRTEVYTRAEVDVAVDARARPIEAELEAARADAATLGERLAALEARLAEVEAHVVPNVCPSVFLPDGTEVRYTQSDHRLDEDFIVCVTELGENVWDQMVRVGDFWIDRYELSNVDDATLPWSSETGSDTSARAISRPGVVPKASVTWFQTAAACVNAGKRLCSNAEWQIAATGTPDPNRSNGADGQCLTEGPNARTTGNARVTDVSDDCVSRFGAEDMIGNLAEWVADWGQAGREWQASDGQAGPPCPGVATGPWPPGYGGDGTWNVDGQVSTHPCGWQKGLPAALVRGGSWSDGDGAGTFGLSQRFAPSAVSGEVGARCCVGG